MEYVSDNITQVSVMSPTLTTSVAPSTAMSDDEIKNIARWWSSIYGTTKEGIDEEVYDMVFRIITQTLAYSSKTKSFWQQSLFLWDLRTDCYEDVREKSPHSFAITSNVYKTHKVQDALNIFNTSWHLHVSRFLTSYDIQLTMGCTEELANSFYKLACNPHCITRNYFLDTTRPDTIIGRIYLPILVGKNQEKLFIWPSQPALKSPLLTPRLYKQGIQLFLQHKPSTTSPPLTTSKIKPSPAKKACLPIPSSALLSTITTFDLKCFIISPPQWIVICGQIYDDGDDYNNASDINGQRLHVLGNGYDYYRCRSLEQNSDCGRNLKNLKLNVLSTVCGGSESKMSGNARVSLLFQEHVSMQSFLPDPYYYKLNMFSPQSLPPPNDIL
jgi:hypothetical protein